MFDHEAAMLLYPHPVDTVRKGNLSGMGCVWVKRADNKYKTIAKAKTDVGHSNNMQRQ